MKSEQGPREEARMEFSGLVEGRVAVPDDAVAALGAGLRGTLLRPGEPGFEDSRTVWNGMIDRTPALVARCLGVADTMHALAFVRAHGIQFSIKGGGHNIAGLAAVDGGLMLDLSAMRGVLVDPAARIARAQAGCLLGDLDRETQVHGLAAALGFVSNTGIAGLTLGGGFGYLTRRFGWTSDTVTAMEVVTADGRLVTASESSHPELFWGLCGGGGNFGIVTRFDYRLFPVGPEILGGAVAWDASAAREVLELQRALLAETPAELNVTVALRPAPPAAWLPADMHGKPIVLMVMCWTGDAAEGERIARRIRALGAPIGDIVKPRPYLTQQSLLDATQPKGRRYYWKSEYMAGVEDALIERAIAWAARATSPHSAVILFPVDGAVARLPVDHSAVGNRDARMVLNIAASWERADEDARHVGWAREAWADMRAFSTGGTYVNFLNEEETGDRVAAAYGPNLARLAAIKAAWDPGNLFRTNKNIVPARAGA
jgi:FAD/FMN-containing dehydrogenase